jgi:hypothetical protein
MCEWILFFYTINQVANNNNNGNVNWSTFENSIINKSNLIRVDSNSWSDNVPIICDVFAEIDSFFINQSPLILLNKRFFVLIHTITHRGAVWSVCLCIGGIQFSLPWPLFLLRALSLSLILVFQEIHVCI